MGTWGPHTYVPISHVLHLFGSLAQWLRDPRATLPGFKSQLSHWQLHDLRRVAHSLSMSQFPHL